MAEQQTEKKITIKQAKRWRLILMIVFCIINFVLPVVFIGIKYKLFTEFNGTKLTLLFIIVALLVTWRFRVKLKEWVNKWEYSIMKYIILGFSKIFIFILLWIVAMLVQAKIGNLVFCTGWIAVCSAVAYLGINPFIEKFDYIVKREIRKQETKEALQEFKELEKEGD